MSLPYLSGNLSMPEMRDAALALVRDAYADSKYWPRDIEPIIVAEAIKAERVPAPGRYQTFDVQYRADGACSFVAIVAGEPQIWMD